MAPSNWEPCRTPNVGWAAAILFYLLFIAGLQLFVIAPALAQGGALQALWQGAFFGLVAYATYDLTNLATLNDWPLLVTAVDLAWGAVLGGAVSFLGTLAANKFFRNDSRVCGIQPFLDKGR